MTPQKIAEKSTAALWANDQASAHMGMKITHIAPGEADLQMRIEEHHLNGNRHCHGGVLFMLADSTFGLACNGYNTVTVSQENTITYIAPGLPGELLTAQGREVYRKGRSGLYDIMIYGEDGRKVAAMRGLCREIRGQHFEDDT